MARAKGNRFQAGALNSLVRALAPEFVQRALRMLSFMRTLGLRAHRDTLVALVTACSQASLISQAHDLYWSAPLGPSATAPNMGLPRLRLTQQSLQWLFAACSHRHVRLLWPGPVWELLRCE